MKIVFDLDGVLRDLNGHASSIEGTGPPDKWDFIRNGKSIYDLVNSNLNLLLDSPPTPYKEVILDHFPVPEIWTNQPYAWRPHTIQWIKNHISPHCEVLFKSLDDKYQELEEDSDTILIDDCPLFRDYGHIILVSYPYNDHIQETIKIYTPESMDNILNILKNA